MKKISEISKSNQGYAALTMTLLVLFSSMAVMGGLSFFAFKEVGSNRAFVKSLTARFAAEAGLEDAVYRLVNGKPITSPETIGLGIATSTVSQTTNSENIIFRAEGQKENFQKNLEVKINKDAVAVNFPFGSQIGEGGLEMSPNVVVSGDVFSNGNIIGASGVSIQGNASAASSSVINSVSVAGSSQAYSILDSTISGFASSTSKIESTTVARDAHAYELKDSTISGDAYYQIIDSQTEVSGQKYPDSPAPSMIPAMPMPLTEEAVDKLKQHAQDFGIISSGNCSQNWSPTTTPYTLTGGVLEKNLVLDNSQVLYLQGTVWVKCNVTVKNGAGIRLSSSYGSQSDVLLADGWIKLQNNGVFNGSGSAGSYLLLLSEATGGGENNSAIHVNNNTTGVIFYADKGIIEIDNGVNVTELTGYKIKLGNNAVLIYESGLGSLEFSPRYDLEYWKEAE